MTAPGTSCSASGRAWPVLVLLWFWLPVGLAWGQAPALAHLVQPRPGTRPLGVVLAELSRQGQLPFSYSSSLVPLTHRCTLRPGPARPLGMVLREVLAAEHLSYGLLNGQLVLWPNRVAAPVGVAAVNGRFTPATRLASLPASEPSAALPTASGIAGKAKPAASGTASAHYLTSRPEPGAPLLSTPSQRNKAFVTTVKSAGTHLLSGTTAPRSPTTARPGTDPIKHSRAESRSAGSPATTRRGSAKAPGKMRLATLPQPGRPPGQGLRSTQAVTAARSPQAVRSAGQPSHQAGQFQRPLALLPARLVSPAPVTVPSDPLPPGQVPASLALIKPVPSPDSTAQKPTVRAGLLPRSYLHGEAWVSETLPLNAAVKLGIPQIYLVLGAAVGPFDHPAGWAWGVGVGTVGRARGRFTPSLEVLQWFLSGPRVDQDAPHDRLIQLRPALAWQLRQGGRWQLVGGPTLNLATGHRARGPFPWPLGQDQWLWVNSDKGPSLLRLWPGVQVGLRF